MISWNDKKEKQKPIILFNKEDYSKKANLLDFANSSILRKEKLDFSSFFLGLNHSWTFPFHFIDNGIYMISWKGKREKKKSYLYTKEDCSKNANL